MRFSSGLPGRPIDEGTTLQDADSCDVEDYPVLFALNRLVAGGDVTPRGALQTWDCVVVDEARELAPLDLQLIGRALAPWSRRSRNVAITRARNQLWIPLLEPGTPLVTLEDSRDAPRQGGAAR
jgi:hypothetical protein